MRGGIAKDQSGFTLPEVLVAMVMMLTVMFALYSIFDMSLRVFSFGNNKVEAVEGARVGVAKMEREIRAAYPYNKGDSDKGNSDSSLLYSPTGAESITFGNDLNNNRKIEDDESSEEITYDLGEDGSTLERNGQPVVEEVSNLQFCYKSGDNAETDDCTSVSPFEAEIVEINLTVTVDKGTPNEGTQTISTDVSLRNRAS